MNKEYQFTAIPKKLGRRKGGKNARLCAAADFLMAGYYTVLSAYYVAFGWSRAVKPGVRRLSVSLGIIAIARGVLLRNQNLGFALTFAVVASGIMPLVFNRCKAPQTLPCFRCLCSL